MKTMNILALRAATVVIILGTLGKSLANDTNNTKQSLQAVPIPINHLAVEQKSIEKRESRGLSSLFKGSDKKKNRVRTASAQLDLDVPFPNPSYTFHQVLDYWPYNLYHTTSLFSIIDFGYFLAKMAKKCLWFIYEIGYISLRIAYQVFDIFQMRKSFVALSQNHGPGWGEDDDDDWRNLRSLGTTLVKRMLI